MKKFMVLFLSITFYFSMLSSMQVQRVIVSTNNNVNYIQFWPIVAKVWQEMGLRPTLALIGDENVVVDESLGDVVRFPPIPGVETSLQAQTVRLLLPILYPDDICIISDIDMLPVSRDYFHKSAIDCSDDSFVIFRDKAYAGWGFKAYPMCYFAARGDTFRDVFGVHRKEDINAKIKEWSELKLGWNTDENVLYSYVNAWGERGGHLVKLGHDVGPRFDRAQWRPEMFDAKKYIDSHCPRPYSVNKASIDYVVSEILKNLHQ